MPGTWRSLLQWGTAFAVLTGSAVAGRLVMSAHEEPKMDVYLDGHRIGTVSSESAVQRWKAARYEAWASMYKEAELTANIEQLMLVPAKRYGSKAEDSRVLEVLEQSAAVEAKAVEIFVDGQSYGIVRNQETAEKLFDWLKRPYVPIPEGGAVMLDESGGVIENKDVNLQFVQQVRAVPVIVSPALVEPSTQVFSKLTAKQRKEQRYIVQKGDCISLIAERFQISAEQLYKENPWIENDLIRIGDTLTWTEQEPLISVKTVETTESIVKVPSSIIYEKDDTLDSGVIQIVSQGKAGLKRVEVSSLKVDGRLTEKRTIAESWVEEPQPTIVKQGIKKSGIGSGKFVSPVIKPRVTSEYGERWGRDHTGTDIVSDELSILASDHGKVVFAGVKSGYGKTIIIDHQNGYQTLYGHLSIINVRKGDKVEKSEKIGVMGSTGRSTGVHLHFEIIHNGEQINPMKYLRG